jgi:hypothetical protein
MHEENADERRDETKTHLRKEDKAANKQMVAHYGEELARGDLHLL